MGRNRFPKHVEVFTDRHGARRVYFRRGKGPRTPLPPDPTSPQFEAAYVAALAGTLRQPVRKTVPTGGEIKTIGDLIATYLASSRYRDLRETTRKGYRWRIEHIRSEHGHRTLAGMTRAGIEKFVLGPFDGKPGQRLALLKMLRVLIQFAAVEGAMSSNPTLGIKRPKSREIRSWTDVEIAQFRAHWPLGTKQRTAFELMLGTGQRRSDVHRMTWADIECDLIRVRQQKTDVPLLIPLIPELQDALAAGRTNHLVIIATEYDKPFTVAGFGQFMRDAITAAGLTMDCKPHGLRKAAARRLAEAGCSAKEIMSVTGHKSLAECERYVRDAEQVLLARAAAQKLRGHDANRVSQTNIIRFGENGETKGKTG